ncbi:MAG: hypothetical protein LBK95_06095 [Bifidobacteriaceae bacterium]|nr:hypothetical protein [Bifidobacteriaceae bacterium]
MGTVPITVSEEHGLTAVQEADKAAKHTHAVARTIDDTTSVGDVYSLLGDPKLPIGDSSEAFERLALAVEGQSSLGTDDATDAMERVAHVQD